MCSEKIQTLQNRSILFPNIHCIHLGTIIEGYSIFIEGSMETCKNLENRISNKEVANLDECRDSCDKTEYCRFFFFNAESKCMLFQSCLLKRSTTHDGTTYKKSMSSSTSKKITQFYKRLSYRY